MSRLFGRAASAVSYCPFCKSRGRIFMMTIPRQGKRSAGSKGGWCTEVANTDAGNVALAEGVTEEKRQKE